MFKKELKSPRFTVLTSFFVDSDWIHRYQKYTGLNTSMQEEINYSAKTRSAIFGSCKYPKTTKNTSCITNRNPHIPIHPAGDPASAARGNDRTLAAVSPIFRENLSQQNRLFTLLSHLRAQARGTNKSSILLIHWIRTPTLAVLVARRRQQFNFPRFDERHQVHFF